MFTRDERRAFLFLMGVAVAGGVVRLVRPHAEAPGEGVVAPHLAGGDLAKQAALVRRSEEMARPLASGEQVDADRADARELERLPRVGPELARRIVADREVHGPFASVEGLSRVPGLGAGTLALLRPAVRFSGVATTPPPASTVREPALAAPAAAAGACATLRRPLPLNAADAAELACLPGIGPALAARIVADRSAHGPFAEVQMLERVPGIGPARIAHLAGRVSAP